MFDTLGLVVFFSFSPFFYISRDFTIGLLQLILFVMISVWHKKYHILAQYKFQ